MDKKTEDRREDILNEMREINRLRQGIVSEQFYGTGDKKQTKPVTRRPKHS